MTEPPGPTVTLWSASSVDDASWNQLRAGEVESLATIAAGDGVAVGVGVGVGDGVGVATTTTVPLIERLPSDRYGYVPGALNAQSPAQPAHCV